MLGIALVNLPFANIATPSLGLTQLQSVIQKNFNGRASVDVHYVNHDFGRFFGIECYAKSLAFSTNTALGDWIFRQSAFPELPDNAHEYFRRYFPHSRFADLTGKLLEKRLQIDGLLDEVIAKYRLLEADIVGMSSMFNQNGACFALGRALKQRNPNILTIMGGANCEAPMGQEIVRNVAAIDYVFSGPALISFRDFVRFCLDGTMDQSEHIRGVFTRANLQSHSDPRQTLGEDDSISNRLQLEYRPFLASLEKTFGQRRLPVNLLFETSRGCWWGERAHCTFCGLNGQSMGYREMQPAQALDQFQELFKYAPVAREFNCVDNIMPKSYPEEVFAKLQAPDDISIFYEVKSDLTEADVMVLARAKVNLIQPGIEALSTSTLKLMKKGSTAFQNVTLLKNSVAHGIWPIWNLLVGFPGEQPEVYEKYLHDLPRLAHLPPPMGVFPVRFDRYSPYFDRAGEFGLDLEPLEFYELTYPFSRSSLRNFAYFFGDTNLSAAYMTSMVAAIGKLRGKCQEWRERWTGAARCSRGDYPMLYLGRDPAATVVHDSRCDSPTQHDVEPLGREILLALKQPKSLNVLTEKLSPHDPSTVAEILGHLEQRGFVFEENRQFLSLVHENQPATKWRDQELLRNLAWYEIES